MIVGLLHTLLMDTTQLIRLMVFGNMESPCLTFVIGRLLKDRVILVPLKGRTVSTRRPVGEEVLGLVKMVLFSMNRLWISGLTCSLKESLRIWLLGGTFRNIIRLRTIGRDALFLINALKMVLTGRWNKGKFTRLVLFLTGMGTLSTGLNMNASKHLRINKDAQSRRIPLLLILLNGMTTVTIIIA